MSPAPKAGAKGGCRVSIFKELFLPSLDRDQFTDGRTGVAYDISLQKSSILSEADLESCFNLIKETSEADYRSSSLGWKPISKKSEMQLPDLEYLLVKKRPISMQDNCKDTTRLEPASSDPQALEAFASFMITYENNCKVIYVYEIHLTPMVRGSGLGAHLMGIIEDIGQRADGVKKAMLTVFASNTRAVRFYEKLGYSEDEFSPKPKRLRGGKTKASTYIILSKNLR
ncbi:MAG: hypothetical protein M1829_001281 [Trizodia sp. TS-e1964]|nr:MAG: hypothetical protein M1829_001281 [Trizodia sp. TS-e1964]